MNKDRLKIRRAKKEDLNEMMRVYSVARENMKKSGNPNQWITYPEEDILLNDIENKNGYVVTDSQNKICACFSLDKKADESYKNIEGQWLNKDEYIAVHRVASDTTHKGIVNLATEYASDIIPNVKIDTHEDNKVMQSVLEKLGFSRCGIVYITDDTSDHSPRIAYQKVYHEKKKAAKQATGLSIGMCLGLSVGMSLGNLYGNTSAGMCIGMCIGMCLGIIIGSMDNKG